MEVISSMLIFFQLIVQYIDCFWIDNTQIAMILGKYKNKRKLGAGGFGMVYQVQDEKGQEYALKLIPKDQLNQLPILKEYLAGQINCMKSVDSPYLIKLYDTFQDKNFIYMLLQFCEGGDLSYYQCNFMDRVFPLDKATQILADVIRGLEYLHGQNYLHRDIKAQNILVKKENGKDIFKLADFGFSKLVQNTKGTNLGTDQFKAPEIFLEKKYSYEVDMWAFGVLFYTMINRDFPFRLPFAGTQQKKGTHLQKLSQNFSFQKSVANSKLQKEEYCTPEMQQLFSGIFQLNQQKRLTFLQLREHPYFKKHFPTIQQSSKMIYSKRIQLISITSSMGKPQIDQNRQENVPVHMSRLHARTEELREEKELLGRRKDQIDFLGDTIELVESVSDLFEVHEVLMLKFNLLKYYVILLRRFRKEVRVEVLEQKYPNLKWKEYGLTKQFNQLVSEIRQDCGKSEIKYFGLFDECETYLPAIKEINQHFEKAFENVIKQQEFEGDFKNSYRASTNYMYSALRKLLKQGKKGNKLHYLLTLLVICHAFNNLFHEVEHLQVIFGQYLQQKNVKGDKIDYSDLKTWLSSSGPEVLIKVALAVIKLYLQ